MKACGLAAAGFLGQQRRNLPVARAARWPGFAGEGGTLTFNAVNVASSGTYPVTIAYLDGSGSGAKPAAA